MWYTVFMEPKRAFGPLLRAKRIKSGRGLVELAEACRIDPGLLSKIEKGERLPPQLPTLLVLAKELGIPPKSDEFAELLGAVDQDRNPALHKMALDMRGGKPWNPFAQLERGEVLCGSLGELVSKATERAISVEASAITVYSPSGRSVTFRIRRKAAKVRRIKKQEQ